MGGQNVPNARGGGELAPKVAPRRLGLLTPKLAIFYRISVERGEFQGPLEFRNFHPPSNFRRFDPPLSRSNYFLGYVISCVVAKHTMWASDYTTELFFELI